MKMRNYEQSEKLHYSVIFELLYYMVTFHLAINILPSPILNRSGK